MKTLIAFALAVVALAMLANDASAQYGSRVVAGRGAFVDRSYGGYGTVGYSTYYAPQIVVQHAPLLVQAAPVYQAPLIQAAPVYAVPVVQAAPVIVAPSYVPSYAPSFAVVPAYSYGTYGRYAGARGFVGRGVVIRR